MSPRPRAHARRPGPESRFAALVPANLRHHLRGRLGAETLPVHSLDPGTRGALWTLYQGYYERTDADRFYADLDEKHDIILLRDLSDGALAGFSTLHVSEVDLDGRRTHVIFSGDTIIAPAYHGQSALQRAFVAYILSVKWRARDEDVYWFLISKGYKTYLLLARNFPSHWPRHDVETPPDARALLDTLATRRFGADYDPATGIVRFSPPGPKLRADVAPLPASPPPDVAFFAARNPGHADGDELCCIGKVDLQLGLAYAQRLAKKVGRRLVSLSARTRR
ncbi:MAG TPA: hypothetical protein PK095_07350 [Myxococcota bacterium]|nr:hypothetical protein [Myxococcota bacterium]